MKGDARRRRSRPAQEEIDGRTETGRYVADRSGARLDSHSILEVSLVGLNCW